MANLQTLERERRLIKVSFARMQNRVLDYLKKPVTYEIIDLLELDLDDLRAEKAKFDAVQRSIFNEMLEKKDGSKTSADLENEWVTECEKVRASLVNLVCRVNAAKRQLDSAVSRESLLNTTTREGSEPSNIRLPKIEVPAFSGDIRDWNDFSNLFKNLVHENPVLSNVQRMYYLKTAMKGAALELTKDYAITDANYVEVWTTLSNRYDNKRATIKAHLSDFFSISKIKSEKEIRKLSDEASKAMRSLKALGENVDNWSTVVTFWVASKLDDKSARDWEVSITDFSKFPSFKQLKTFMNARAAILEDASIANKYDKIEKKSEAKRNVEQKSKTNLLVAKVKCYVCGANHFLPDCDEFRKKPVDQRFEIVKANHLCINCFCRKHSTYECKAPKCKNCDRKHHILLHRQPTETKETGNIPSNKEPKIENTSVKLNLNVNSESAGVLLPTAVVKVVSENRRVNKFARVILDSASQTNLVSESLVQRLKLPSYRNVSVLGCLGGKSVISAYACAVKISSRHSENEISFSAEIVPYIPYETPINDVERLIRNANITDSAETRFMNGKVEILLGAEFYEKCMMPYRRFHGDVAERETIFGKVVFGKMSEKYELNVPPVNKCLLTIDEQLRRFWELEEIDLKDCIEDEEMSCVKHFEETIKRNNEGRFVARLPLKDRAENLAKLYFRAENSLKQLEKRCDPELKLEVNKFMLDYESKMHMKRIEHEKLDRENYFIPYQIVRRPQSTTTKVRVVFNASAKSKSGVSLNDILMKGPQIQADIMTILIKFRRHRVAFTADIAQMYRQIQIDPVDSKLQRILWRYNSTEPIQQYELTTLTYGTTPASFIATQCLATVARDVQDEYPDAAQVIRAEFYMDDLMTGASSLQAAIALQKQVHECLSRYHLPLRKYVSNSNELLQQLDENLVLNKNSVELNNTEDVSILGLIWIPHLDKFQVKLNLVELPEKITKRVMLSELARVFDPLGFLSPATIKGKLLLQKLWKHQLTWDQQIPTELLQSYLKFRKQLSDVKDLQIERKFCNHQDHSDVQLCGFADASEKAYAAVVYVKCRLEADCSTYIVCAKTRVAPLQGSTIPRLELRAAELLAELVKKTAAILNISFSRVTCYSDSMIVIGWLNKNPSKLQTFVANRVKKIKNSIPSVKWKFVKSVENPADLATRGLKVSECASDAWLRGPPNLSLNESEWGDLVNTSSIELPELKKKANLCLTKSQRFELVFKLVDRNSYYPKLIRVVAYVIRFSANCRSRNNRENCGSIQLSRIEFDRSLTLIIRACQAQFYSDEYVALKQNEQVSRKSRLYSFHPFIDSQGVIRVGGRLRNAGVDFDRTHPILLPANCNFAKMYIRFLHESYFHATISFLTSFVGKKFRFVSGLRNVIRWVCHQCVVCRRYNKDTLKQIMGQLPSDRLNFVRPFAVAGVDYAGPITLRPIEKRSKLRFKSYIAVFVCYTTRAVHLEVVPELTTAAFFSALKRFVGRRGCPEKMYSDNATNFWGAVNLLNNTDIESFPTEHKIKWIFNPPSAPHFGGIFEAAVKSMKHHLIKTIGGQTLNYEELSTLTIEIEAVLNSRPISIPKDDLEEYLTPGHFLTGSHLLFPPEPDQVDVKLPVRWRLLQDLKKTFWRQWRNDYFNKFQKFSKWHHRSPNLQVDDVVFLKEDDTPPFKYKLARVVKLFPGKDGVVRVVEVKTRKGSFLRPVTKLSPAVGSMLETSSKVMKDTLYD